MAIRKVVTYLLQKQYYSIRNVLRDEWDIHKLRAELWHASAEAPRVVDEDTAAQAEAVWQDIAGEYQRVDAMETKYIERKALRYGFEMPDKSNPEYYAKVEWDIDPNEPLYLTSAGKEHLREMLHAIRKERREAAGFWLALVLGLLGSITGLIAVINQS